MTVENKGFHRKSREALDEQVQNVTNVLGHPIVPPSLSFDYLDTPIDEIKRRFPNFYGVYVDVLKSGNQPANRDPDINEDALAQQERNGQIRDNLQSYLNAHYEGVDARTLWDRQVDVFEDLRDFIEDGEREGWIKLPTGTGKTVLFTEIIEAIGLPALIVVPTKVLVRQTGEKIEEFASDLDYGLIYSRAKQYGRQVTITTYNSLVSGIENGTLKPDEYDVLILDEAHRSLSKPRRKAIAQFTNSLRLSFTATPRPKQLGKEIHSMQLREAVEQGLLSPFSVYAVRSDIDLSSIKVNSRGDYDQQQLERAINVEARNQAAIQIYQDMFKGEKAVVYCVGVNHAARLAKMFADQGINAQMISGASPNQDEILASYLKGEIQVLCNADLLIEGFDDPEASVCLNLRPTLSKIVAEQRGGRVLRKDPGNPRKHAYIVDFVDGLESSRKRQIGFAQIADGAEILGYSDERHGNTSTRSSKNEAPEDEVVISGLRVIIRPEEVMRLSNSGERSKNETLIDLDENEIAITQKSLSQLFVGRKEPVRESAEKVIEIIRNTHPALLISKRNKLNRSTLVIADRRLFLQLMQEQGLRLHVDSDLGSLESDILVTDSYLRSIFAGRYEKIIPAARRVLERIKRENPGIVVQRLRSTSMVDIVTDRDLFVRLMREEGVVQKDKTILEIEPGELSIGYDSLRRIFSDQRKMMYPTANEIIDEIEKDNPSLVQTRSNRGKIVRVITDPSVFIQRMQERGFKLK